MVLLWENVFVQSFLALFNLCFPLMVICINAESVNSILVITDSLVTHYHGKSARC